MMDGRKLDINAPLMSVRRSCAPSPSLTETKKKVLEKHHTHPHNKSDMIMDQVTEPVAVPFNWEHIPGRSKGTNGPKESTRVPNQPLEKECNDANQLWSLIKSSSLSEIDCDRERKDDKIRPNVEEEDDDDDDEVYSDALDTLSSTESISMNCSASGVSGLNSLDANKCGTNATDKQTQDFMMNRFLPAAKAMTFHPPQYASSRKQQSVLAQQQQPREIVRLVREQKKSIVKKHITDIVPYIVQCQEEEEESSDEAKDYDESTNVSGKGCGMFSRLGARNSLCLLNPVAGMKMKNSSHTRSCSPAPAIKKAWDAIHKSKSSSSGAASPDHMHEPRKKWSSEPKRFAYSGEMKQQVGRLSPFRRSRNVAAAAVVAGASTLQSKPQSLFPGARLHCDSKISESNHNGKMRFSSRRHGSMQDVMSQGTKRSSNSGSTLATEKTLYVDTVSAAKLSCSNSCSVVLDNKREGKERSSIKESSQDTKGLLALEENLDSEAQAADQESMSLQLVQSSLDKDTEINNNKQIVAVDHHGKVGAELVLVSPLPQPLMPKSPSESWLSRALPLVYMKNSFPYSNQGTQSLAKRQGLSASSRYSKWETIVKTSNLHHGHVNFSQELTIYEPQHSKS